MARYKPYDLNQTKMIPLSYADQIIEGSFEYALNEVVEEHLDMTVFAHRYHNDETGRLAYDPKVLLKVVIYAYYRGIISSRRIAEACCRNVVFPKMVARHLGVLVLFAFACSGTAPSRQVLPQSAPPIQQDRIDLQAEEWARNYIPRSVWLVAAGHSSAPMVMPVLSVDSTSIYLWERALVRWSDNQGSLGVQWYPRVLGALMRDKTLWLQVNPGKEFPGFVGFALDQNTPLVLVKSLAYTATFAGYPDIMLYVRQGRSPDHLGVLHISGHHPAFGTAAHWRGRRYVSLAMESPGNVLYTWYENERPVAESVHVRTDGLGESLRASFDQFATYKSASDTKTNWVVLSTPNSTPIGAFVPVLDAVQVPHKPYRMPDGKVYDIEAFDTILALEESELALLKTTWKAASWKAAEIAASLPLR